MPAIRPLEPASAQKASQELLASAEKIMRRPLNMLRTMAHSPVMLDIYLRYTLTLESSRISSRHKTLIAIAVAGEMGGDYLLSLMKGFAARDGISNDEFAEARAARSDDQKVAAMLDFCVKTVRSHGKASADLIKILQGSGYSDEEIIEIIGVTALNVFRNYFNLAIGTDLDV